MILNQWSCKGGSKFASYLKKAKLDQKYVGNASNYYNFDGEKIISHTDVPMYEIIDVKLLSSLINTISYEIY